MAEWILTDKDIGMDGAYYDYPELIRCKDCKHWQCDDSESYCDELGIFGTSPTSYCSFAKRKEE